jgi:hypothetical protein
MSSDYTRVANIWGTLDPNQFVKALTPSYYSAGDQIPPFAVTFAETPVSPSRGFFLICGRHIANSQHPRASISCAILTAGAVFCWEFGLKRLL